jgi:hypothetical protein
VTLARAGRVAIWCALPLIISCSLRIIEPDRFPEAVRLHDVTPYIQEPQQCGPYALAAVQNFMGLETDPAEMSGRLYSSGAGGTLTMDLYLEASRSGFAARQTAGSLSSLREQLGVAPVIVLFRYPALVGSGGHFIVVTGYSLSLMDSQKVHQTGGAQDAAPGVGAPPSAGDGFTPPGGGSRQGRDRPMQNVSKIPVARSFSNRNGFFLLWGDGRVSWMDEKKFDGMWSGSDRWMLEVGEKKSS